MVIIKIKDKKIQAELADSFLKQARGLMFSKKKNMLFAMGSEDYHSFWMFGVRFPIQMIFINSEFKIVDIQDAEPLTADRKTWKIYKPKEKCRYVLELVDGSKLKVGDKIELA